MLVLSLPVSLFLCLFNLKNNTAGKAHKILTDIPLIIVSVVPIHQKRDIGYFKPFCVTIN